MSRQQRYPSAVRDCWQVPAEPDQIGVLRRRAAAFAAAAGLDAPALADLRIAVSEAVTNAVVHAYGEAESAGAVRVSAAACEGGLTILVRDYGAGMETASSSPGMGCGLGLIATLTEACEVRPCDDGGTEVRMQFALPA